MNNSKHEWGHLKAQGVLADGIESLSQYEDKVSANYSKFVDKSIDKKIPKIMPSSKILVVHGELFGDVMHSAGQFSKKQMAFGGMTGSPPANFAKDIKALDVRFKKMLAGAKTLDQKIEALAVQHASLVNIHPFEDGNGRSARAILEVNINTCAIKHGLKIEKPPIEPEKKAYINALNLARNQEQIGPLCAVIAENYGLDYTGPLMRKSPFKINTEQSSHSTSATIESINESKTLATATETTSKGAWLKSLDANKLISVCGGSFTKEGKVLSNSLGTNKQQTMGEALSYISALKRNGIKGSLFNKYDPSKMDNFAKVAFDDFRKTLPDNQRSKFDKVIDRALAGNTQASKVDMELSKLSIDDFTSGLMAKQNNNLPSTALHKNIASLPEGSVSERLNAVIASNPDIVDSPRPSPQRCMKPG